MNKLARKEIIKEEIFNILKEENKKVKPKPTIVKPKPNMPSNIKTIKNDLDDQGNNFKPVRSKNQLVQALDLIINNVKEQNPEFVESNTFKRAIRAFATKHM